MLICFANITLQNRKGCWYIDLDISAPKLIVPENVLEASPALVVMDLGNFRLKTVVDDVNSAPLDEEGGTTDLKINGSRIAVRG